MKNYFPILFAFTALAATSTYSSAIADNLILNGGFEDVLDGMPMQWEQKLSVESEGDGIATTGEVRIDETEARGDSHSLYLRSDGPRWASAVQRVKLEPGAKYLLKAFAKSPSKDSFVCISVKGSRKGTDKKLEYNAKLPEGSIVDWTPIELEFVAPLDLGGASVWLRVLFNRKSPQEAWFDDVSLERID